MRDAAAVREPDAVASCRQPIAALALRSLNERAPCIVAGRRFRTSDFRFSGSLSPEANAGNQFYGEDVAQFIAAGLTGAGLQAAAIDEDWGWMVSGRLDETSTFEVAVYNLNDHGEGGRPGAPEWGLWIRLHQAVKRFGFLPGSKEVPATPALLQTLDGMFAERGISLEPWDDGPGQE